MTNLPVYQHRIIFPHRIILLTYTSWCVICQTTRVCLTSISETHYFPVCHLSDNTINMASWLTFNNWIQSAQNTRVRDDERWSWYTATALPIHLMASSWIRLLLLICSSSLGALGLHATSFDVSYLQIQAFSHFGTISGQATAVSNPEGPQDLLSIFLHTLSQIWTCNSRGIS